LDPLDFKNRAITLSADGSGGTEITIEDTNRLAGFDIGNFPGKEVMEDLWNNTNLSWTAYYLDAPNHTTITFPSRWTGNRATLAAIGWQLAPIYVGRQNPAKESASNLGVTDGVQAADELRVDGFSIGQTVYLDIEFSSGPVLNPGLFDYIPSWFSKVKEAGFTPAIYCTGSQATIISGIVPGCPMWVINTHPIPTIPNGGVVLPTPDPKKSGFASAGAFQYQIDTYNLYLTFP
jgi:hypothetical protein